jgi:Tol biopolymer transport system component
LTIIHEQFERRAFWKARRPWGGPRVRFVFLRTRRRRLVSAALVALPLVTFAADDLAASPPRAMADAANRILLSSDRDGRTRGYAIEPEGSALTPLLPPARALEPIAVSGDRNTVAYTNANGVIYVSRANGTHLRKVVRSLGGDAGEVAAVSRDGKLLAFRANSRSGAPIAVVRTDGRGRRNLSRGICWSPDWSPSGKSVVYAYWDGEQHYAVIVQTLRGKRRVLVRVANDVARGVAAPVWSPRGRWIAYLENRHGQDRYDLDLVRPNGTRRHRLARDVDAFAWSPDGRRLAFASSEDVAVIGVDGRGFTRLHVHLWTGALRWSPDGRQLALAVRTGEDPAQIWVVGVDGTGLSRITSAGENTLVGWTGLRPVQPQAVEVPPTERVVGADAVETRSPIKDLSADGPRVAFIPGATATDCEHVSVWTPGEGSIQRFRLPSPCAFGVYDVELAGSRAAWMSHSEASSFLLKSATLTEPIPQWFAVSDTVKPDYQLHGDGDLLVFSGGSQLIRIGTGREKCGSGVCTTIRRGAHTDSVASVSGGLIAIREPNAVAVVDDQGNLVRVLPFAGGISAAVLDGDRLIVSRSGTIESYGAATGALELSRPLPAGYRLADADGGIAVLLSADTVMLLRLDDGRSLTLAPGGGPTLADLEPPGLYYAHPVGRGGRVALLPRSEILQQLG